LSNDGINLAGIDRLDSAGTDYGSNDLDDIVYSAQITTHYYYLWMTKKRTRTTNQVAAKMEAPRQRLHHPDLKIQQCRIKNKTSCFCYWLTNNLYSRLPKQVKPFFYWIGTGGVNGVGMSISFIRQRRRR
jgi:hypothetical protein